MASEEKIYCSLDIETSGFDPLTNEILEVGFVFFKLTGKSFKIIEEWSRVFLPSRPVPPNILGLTGISQKELDSAEKFSEHREFLQEKLGEATIVGHNVIFDIKFLEAFGVKFSGAVIDTLDLVQFILPTHHSYNLENLMHTFGISHKEAHRALADSKATLKLLEKLLQVYSSFPEGLKNQMKKLVELYNFSWKDFFSINFPLLPFNTLAENNAKHPELFIPEFKLEAKYLYNFSLNQEYPEFLAKANLKKKVLLVVPKARAVLDLYRRGFAKKAIFTPDSLFDERKLLAFVNKKNLSEDEVKFLLKVLVWQKTNWQTETLLDLNLSFFGGQYKSLICGGKIRPDDGSGNAVCDMATFLYLSENKLYKNFHAVICGLNEFETAVTSNIGTKTSWGYISYLLKSFYNPELGSGEQKFKQEVVDGLSAGDLFFGLAGALLKDETLGFAYFKITPESENGEKYQKIKSAAENYGKKLLALNRILSSKEIEKFTADLDDFFSPQENRVKWVELSERSCAFLSMPLDISGLVKKSLEVFSKVSFADSLDSKILPSFFLKRLGLESFTVKSLELSKSAGSGKAVKQGDLFSGLKKAVFGKAHKINYYCLPQTSEPGRLLEILQPQKSLPAAVLFGSSLQVREFYEQNYQELKTKASLLAQTASGGSNKIFRNFSIGSNGLLLATDKFILKALSGRNAVESVSRLSVRTLVLCHLPFEQFSHPYQEALSKNLPNAFEDYALPRAFYNFHNLIKFFYTPMLKNIYIIDSKLGKSYAGVFKDYYKVIPEARSAS